LRLKRRSALPSLLLAGPIASLAEGIAAAAIVTSLVSPEALEELATDRAFTEQVNAFALNQHQEAVGQGLGSIGLLHRAGRGNVHQQRSGEIRPISERQLFWQFPRRKFREVGQERVSYRG